MDIEAGHRLVIYIGPEMDAPKYKNLLVRSFFFARSLSCLALKTSYPSL